MSDHQWHGFNCSCGCCNGFCAHLPDEFNVGYREGRATPPSAFRRDGAATEAPPFSPDLTLIEHLEDPFTGTLSDTLALAYERVAIRNTPGWLARRRAWNAYGQREGLGNAYPLTALWDRIFRC